MNLLDDLGRMYETTYECIKGFEEWNQKRRMTLVNKFKMVFIAQK